ncbi:MAG: RNA polymerase sigma factor [Alphaproteobacteria bacterium]
MRNATDEEFMLAYAAGDALAFDALYARHRASVFRYVRRHVGQDRIAEEIFQDIWMRVIKVRGRYAASARFTTWLYTIAHNRLMDYFRSVGAKPEEVPLPNDDDDDCDAAACEENGPEPSLIRRRLAERILEALDALPVAQREAFILQQEGDLTVEEIARVTGVTRETAKSRLRYALVKLRQNLKDMR